MYDANAQSSLDVPLRKVSCEELSAVEWEVASNGYFIRWNDVRVPVTIAWVQGTVKVVERRSDPVADRSTTHFDVYIADHSGTVNAVTDQKDLIELDQVVDGDYCAALLELSEPQNSRLNLHCVRLTPMPAAFHSLWIQELDAYRSQLCK
uniref:Uncharacterized protein n=1 Tax=Plectus sambesii TaxID=2011161 RepID=A0A914VIQ1_9BILA